jgi:putative membrane protein
MGLLSEDTQTRDDLARVRTELANERTLLAYIRTSLALIVAGVTAMHFLRGGLFMWAGAALLSLGGICLALGAFHFNKTRGRIRRL